MWIAGSSPAMTLMVHGDEGDCFGQCPRIRYDEKFKQFYEELLGRGKSKMVAVTAVMRKMIVRLNAWLKSFCA